MFHEGKTCIALINHLFKLFNCSSEEGFLSLPLLFAILEMNVVLVCH